MTVIPFEPRKKQTTSPAEDSLLRTLKSLYRFEVSKLMCLRRNANATEAWWYDLLYRRRMLYALMHIYDLSAFLSRVHKKIKRLLRKRK